ncbi:MAG TPA: hypothetical protein VLH39_05855, partial [Magnetospirillaceae bacterium]|nr:hypothetical protein [Magnetospirillaceae bacterium]
MRIPAALILAVQCLVRPIAQDASWLGLWEGRLFSARGELPASLEIFAGGGLLSMPGQAVFSWPVRTLSAKADHLYLSMDLMSNPLELAGFREGSLVSGALIMGGQRGSFELRRTGSGPDGERVFDTGRGLLPGTLVLPDGRDRPVPLVILLADSGTVDRDGNNWRVPGRNDALRMLAEELKKAGVASYRYDKRGAGRAYRMVEDEAALVFEDHVRDAEACLRSFEGDGDFAPIVVFGLGDGALVGAAALGRISASTDLGPDATGRGPAYALAVAGVSGRSLRELIEGAADGAGRREETAAILAELDAGRFVDDVSPSLQGLFRRSFQPYLASWLSYDLEAELAGLSRAGLPVLLLRGDRDLQATPEDFDRLRRAVPYAESAILPETNRILKRVGTDSAENYASFLDPSFALSPQVVPAL